MSKPRRPLPARTVNWAGLARSAAPVADTTPTPKFAPPVLPPGVLPDGRTSMAMDSACASVYAYANAYMCDAPGFPGYANLAAQAQKPEFRRMAEIIAAEMCRKWIRVTGSPDDTRAEKVAQIEADLVTFKVREVFREAAEQDGLFGGSHVYIDLKMPGGAMVRDNPDELGTPLMMTKTKIGVGSLEGFRNIEATWTSPNNYNSDKPLAPNFYVPQSWFVMGQQTHASRLLTFCARQVPDILKPAYNFLGLSLTQIADPYVANWLRTRNSVGDLLHNFSLTILKTDLSALLQSGASCDLAQRVQGFNQLRDNKGLMVADNEHEAVEQLNVPLSGLDKLQAQAQEHMASVTGIPLVKLLGITPTGLNASSEGEIRVFYDWINAMQQWLFAPHLKKVLDVIQLNRWGEIDGDIGFEFVPLYQMTDAERAEINNKNATTTQLLIDSAVITPQEGRIRLQSDTESGYAQIDPDEEVDLPEFTTAPAPENEE